MKPITFQDLIKIDTNVYEIPKSFRADMRVPARVFMNEIMAKNCLNDSSLEQLVNVATLPGIQKYAMAMPDFHQGYGFPIGGVAGMAINQGGVISPGGIGYDINCGVRLLAVNMTAQELQPYLEKLATHIFNKVPSGVGKGGNLSYKAKELDRILKNGARHMLELGFGNEGDLEFCQERGSMSFADPDLVSDHAKKRGADQLGTLGSGNHFLEIQKVDEIFDEHTARVFGLAKDHVTVMIHCGSRGLGHQTCTDYVRTMMAKSDQWGYVLPDRELVCAPWHSKEAQDYYKAMAAAANFAWANRHMIGHWVRESFGEVISKSIAIRTVYDVSHNIGTLETHNINEKDVELIMHRKGATRAFGPGHKDIPALYRAVGQPVLIPGTMGTASYVLAGTQESMEVAFGSSCHGAGRTMSRAHAKKTVIGRDLREQLTRRGIIIRSESDPGLAEEAPIAYKDVDNVVNVVDGAGLAKKVARVTPLAVIKGD
ncbi:MAG: RtcB family protein [Candidatus Babeliales bacterium]|nr:RtcB family protein [Candidatus Babeliales bacterium]